MTSLNTCLTYKTHPVMYRRKLTDQLRFFIVHLTNLGMEL
jgi:hypothetical protein